MPVVNEKSASTREPYFTRLKPVIGEFGFNRNRQDGSEYTAQLVSVYDDREVSGVIKVQFREMRQPNPKVAVFTFDNADKMLELLTDLASAHAELTGDAPVEASEVEVSSEEVELPAL
jgi:hypothetical protein